MVGLVKATGSALGPTCIVDLATARAATQALEVMGHVTALMAIHTILKAIRANHVSF